MNSLYLTVTKDGSINLLPYLPNKKYLMDETKIFELPRQTPIEYIYSLIKKQLANQGSLVNMDNIL